MPSVLARLDRFETASVVRTTAAAYPGPSLPSLDAIHLEPLNHFVHSVIDRAGYL